MIYKTNQTLHQEQQDWGGNSRENVPRPMSNYVVTDLSLLLVSFSWANVNFLMGLWFPPVVPYSSWTSWFYWWSTQGSGWTIVLCRSLNVKTKSEWCFHFVSSSDLSSVCLFLITALILMSSESELSWPLQAAGALTTLTENCWGLFSNSTLFFIKSNPQLELDLCWRCQRLWTY